MQGRLVLGVGIAALVLSGAAGGYVVGREVTIRPGDTATFGPAWRCHYGYPRAGDVDCFVGDQTPGVQLLGSMPHRLTVSVRTTVGSTRVRKVRKRVCAEPTRCWREDTYVFSGGAGG